MSSEANLPEMSAPQAPPPPPSDMQIAGDGQQGAANGRTRRRRRKRKKGGAAPQGEGQQNQAANGENAGSISASTEAPSAPQQASNSQPQQQGNGQGQGQSQGKRWKKKKFGGREGGGGQNRGPRPEPGNSAQGSNGGRRNTRQGKQRGPRAFVGPMDHSYREVNGNYAEATPSTMDGNGGGRRQNHRREFNEDRLPPELLTSQRAIAIPEGAPTHIYFFVEDLFLTAKINETARNQGVKVAFMKPEKDIVAQLADLHEHEHPSLIVFDLNSASMKALTLIPKIKAKLKKGTSIIGFLNLLQAGEIKMKAMEVGCNTVMTKAAFSQSLPNLIRRYGIADDEEQNFNQ